MSRPSLRRTPKLETLEVRQVLSSVAPGPSPDQQYALELINLVRTNPSEAANMLTANITPGVQATLDQYGLTVGGLVNKLDSATPQPPLAWSDTLASTAQAQSQYQASTGVQTHQGPGESSLSDRITGAGYTNYTSIGENTYAYADSVDEAMQSFLFDWGVSDDGHFNNLLQPGVSAENAYKDVGIALVNTNNNRLGPIVLTQDFGAQQNEGPQILGVVYDDPNNTGFYSQGEGLAGVTIDAVNVATGQDIQTQSMSAGGYQMPVPAGTYEVTASENGQTISSQQVQVGDVNVMADFVNNPSAQVQQSSTPTPTPTPFSIQTPDSSSQASTQTSDSSSQSSQFSQDSQAMAQLLMAIPPQQDQTPQPVQAPTASTTPAWLSGWSSWKAAVSTQ
jgi:uncharacterized protein YkwD